MKYAITFAHEAQEGLAKLKRSEPASYKKAVSYSSPSHQTSSLRLV